MLCGAASPAVRDTAPDAAFSSKAGLQADASRAPAAPSPPSSEELRLLLERMIAATHRSDAAEAEYARTEHWVERRHAADADPSLDRTYRVYPTGTGTVKIVAAEAGAQVTPQKYRDELHELDQALVWALDPAEPRQQARVVKWKKRTAERFRAVEGFRDAYQVTWIGAETLPNSPSPRPLAKLLLDPKPGPASGSIATELLAASRLTIWVQPESGAVVQLDAELVRDLSFGGGLLGKIDKGGRVHIEQMQVAPDIWLPRTTTDQVQGRKLLSHQESARTIEARDYRRVGPPADLLPLVRRELDNAGIRVPAP
ncbi:MAG TPA: hypothetical protein VJW51_08750 [Candidatus Acidoferrales bacterium]|nr:hypothetical protein [Candidatus Acidoferrales bacterium]